MDMSEKLTPEQARMHPVALTTADLRTLAFLTGEYASLKAIRPATLRGEPGVHCPVCGMFVAKYPNWVAEILFKDGKTVFFDGAKDLFKYYFDIKKYDPHKTKADIASIYVTEYYALTFINANKAYYVIGSDVYGPMGRELIPFKDLSECEEFMSDHKGKRVITFKEITPKLIDTLD